MTKSSGQTFSYDVRPAVAIYGYQKGIQLSQPNTGKRDPNYLAIGEALKMHERCSESRSRGSLHPQCAPLAAYPSMKSLALCSAAMAFSSGRPTRSRKQSAGSARIVLYFS